MWKNQRNVIIYNSSQIRNHTQILWKNIKTKDPIFYQRWTAMRTRTTNPNYHAANCYSQKNIHSDEFTYFIDFYDAMYVSYKELADKIGANNTSLERLDNDKPYTKENCI